MTALSSSSVVVAPEPQHRVRTVWVRVVLWAAAVLALAEPAFRYRIVNRDEATIATVARAADAGRTLYQGIVDRKPPLVFELAQLVGAHDLRVMRALGLLAVALTAVVSSRIGRLLGYANPLHQHVLVAIAAVALFPLEDGMAAGFELFALPTLALVLYGCLRGNPVAVGVCGALAVMTKQTALFPVGAAVLVAGRRWGPGFVGRATGIGAVVALVVSSRYPPMDLFRWTFLDGSGYLGGVTAASLVRDSLPALLRMLVAMVPVSALAWRAGGRREPEVVAMAIGAVISILPGLRLAPHYALFLLVPLLPACTAGAFSRPLTRVHAGAATALAVMAVIHQVPALNPSTESFDELGAAVRSITDPAQEIFVWGQVSTVYWQSDRLPATSFPTTGFATGHGLARRPAGPLRSHTTPLWGRLQRELRRAAPPVLVDTSGSLGVPHPSILESPLNGWVREHYLPYRVVQGAVIWIRVD